MGKESSGERRDKNGEGEEEGPPSRLPGAPRGGGQTVPFDAQPGGQVSPVAVGDVRIVLEGHGDLLVSVQANAAGHQDRPVLVAAQLDVMRALQQLLMHPPQPSPLPHREAPPGPASPGRGLRCRSPRPGAGGRCASSYDAACPGPAASTHGLLPSALRLTGGVAARSDVSTPRRAPPLGRRWGNPSWGVGAQEFQSQSGP